jgi:outer membrane biosynthesis protein TonB
MRALLAAVVVLLPGSALAQQSTLQARAAAVDSAARTSAMFEFQVERPAKVVGTPVAPRYPAALRAAGVAGTVMARFEVDTLGMVDIATFKVVRASREEFALAVREALSLVRYTPARHRGRLVRQVVIQSFEFTNRR